MPGKGRIPFEPFDYQQEALLNQAHFRWFNKARQCGMTTDFACEADFYGSRGNGEQIVIVSKNLSAAKNFGRYVRDIAIDLEKKDPDRTKIKRITQLLIEYEDGSTIQSIASSQETGRSISASRIYFDEVAFTQWVEDIFQAVMPSIEQTGGYMTGFSTPKGRAGLFAKICKQPAEYGFTYQEIPWWLNPVYNPYLKQFLASTTDIEREKWLAKAKQGDWYQKAKKKYTELAFKQEFECSFDADADSVYSQRQLDKVFYSHGVKEFYRFDNYIIETWWQKPRLEGHLYASFVDFGRKRDATVIITYDMTANPCEMVEYKRIAPGTAEWSDILLEVRNTYAYYKSELRGDATGVGDGIFEAIADIAEPVIISNSQSQGKKYNLIENSRKAYDFAILRMPKIPQLYEEHEKYTWDDKDIVQDSVIANAGAIAIFYDPENEGLYLGADVTINAED